MRRKKKSVERGRTIHITPGDLMRSLAEGTIRYGPVRHVSLPAKLGEEVNRLYHSVGRYHVPTLEQWELGFMRDMHPHKEVALWQRIERAFLRYSADNPQADKSDTVFALVLLSFGADTSTPLRRYWDEAGETDGGPDGTLVLITP